MSGAINIYIYILIHYGIRTRVLHIPVFRTLFFSCLRKAQIAFSRNSQCVTGGQRSTGSQMTCVAGDDHENNKPLSLTQFVWVKLLVRLTGLYFQNSGPSHQQYQVVGEFLPNMSIAKVTLRGYKTRISHIICVMIKLNYRYSNCLETKKTGTARTTKLLIICLSKVSRNRRITSLTIGFKRVNMFSRGRSREGNWSRKFVVLPLDRAFIETYQ